MSPNRLVTITAFGKVKYVNFIFLYSDFVAPKEPLSQGCASCSFLDAIASLDWGYESKCVSVNKTTISRYTINHEHER